jgi:outer membrane protein assembly factor BamB
MLHSTAAHLYVVAAITVFWPSLVAAADQPQWGQPHTRNMVSDEKGLPETFDAGRRNGQGGIDLKPDGGVRWVARLGAQSYGSPVVAGGRVYVGTNNESPRDDRLQGDRGVLMCFDEKTGDFLWQLCLPKYTKVKWSDWHYVGITSTPVAEGDRLYLVSNRGEVMCLDARGMANGNDGPFKEEGRLLADEGKPPIEPGTKDADILWLYDMPGTLGVEPHNASNCSILIDGDLLYVCTSNGADWTHTKMINPAAPTTIVLDKKTGRLLARDDFGIGPDIFHGQWSSPAMGVVGSKKHLYQGAGNGFLYAFEALDPKQIGEKPATLKNVWRFNGHPLAQTQDNVPIEHIHDSHSFEITANPVFYKDRVYVAVTQEVYHKMMEGWFCCIDATKTGDITRGGLVWSFKQTQGSVSTVAIADGLVYYAEFTGKLHCLDAETGRCYWTHDTGKPVWGSPLVADGKIYFGTAASGAALWVLSAGKELKVIGRVPVSDAICCTPTAANGTLFVATNKHLYAVEGKKR